MVMGGVGQHTDQRSALSAEFGDNAPPFSKLDQAPATGSAGAELAAGDDSR